jgi:RNA polymerase sigma-70 factor (ECF subfamily)
VGVPREARAGAAPAFSVDADSLTEMGRHASRTERRPDDRADDRATATADRATAGPDPAPSAVARTIGDRDRRAFTQLIHEHDQRLRGLAYRLLGDADLMDEALQEAYVKAFVALPSFNGRSSIGTWLYRITYTTCIDALRRPRRLPTLPGDLLECVSDPAPDPGDELAERERLSVALAALPPEQRAAVLLVDRDGYDYKTVAEILEVPPGTAASRVSAARRALRHALGSAAAEEER